MHLAYMQGIRSHEVRALAGRLHLPLQAVAEGPCKLRNSLRHVTYDTTIANVSRFYTRRELQQDVGVQDC
jgi:hypothetical protein